MELPGTGHTSQVIMAHKALEIQLTESPVIAILPLAFTDPHQL